MDDALCRRLARELASTVVAVDYRLAPKFPYPIALQDCYDALTWLASKNSAGVSKPIAVAGASAGGGLAAALALLARDRGEIDLSAQVLIYPMLDDRSAQQPDPDRALRRMWNNTSGRIGWKAYLGDADPTIAVPARRLNLTGVAPAWIGVGSLDVLHPESVEYAARLGDSDVACELVVVPGAFHGFDAVAPKTAVAQSFWIAQRDWLRQLLWME